ncbi:uncharacterized protein V6R79_013365 [Siganus canaliculatus]
MSSESTANSGIKPTHFKANYLKANSELSDTCKPSRSFTAEMTERSKPGSCLFRCFSFNDANGFLGG